MNSPGDTRGQDNAPGAPGPAIPFEAPDAEHMLESLTRLPKVLHALLDGLDERLARKRGADGGWSILEILGHLVDEERDDFAPRLFALLEEPTRPWESIDPEAQVIERAWNQNGSVAELLWILMTERASALARLRVFPRPDWARSMEHPTLGKLTAADLLTSWVVHDQLHLRQLLGRLNQLTEEHAGSGSSSYAGTW